MLHHCFRRSRLGALLLAAMLVGCSGGKTPYPVHGRVVDAEGNPAVGAMLIFHPLNADESNSTKPVGQVDQNGEYSLTTFKQGDGAPAAEYAVTIVWFPPKSQPFGSQTSDRLQGAYANAKESKIHFTVEKRRDNEMPTIQLQ